MTFSHTPTPGISTTPISPICPECGTMQKSGQRSCCGRGGSWFGKCGSANKDNTNLGYTWYEGIRVCQARQPQAAVEQQRHASQPQTNASFNDTSMGTDSKTIIVANHNVGFAPINTSRPISVTTSSSLRANTADRKSIAHDIYAIAKAASHASASASTTARKCEKFSHIIAIALFIVGLY